MVDSHHWTYLETEDKKEYFKVELNQRNFSQKFYRWELSNFPNPIDL